MIRTLGKRFAPVIARTTFNINPGIMLFVLAKREENIKLITNKYTHSPQNPGAPKKRKREGSESIRLKESMVRR